MSNDDSKNNHNLAELRALIEDFDAADFIEKNRNCLSQKYILPRDEQLLSRDGDKDNEALESLLSENEVDDMMLAQDFQPNPNTMMTNQV